MIDNINAEPDYGDEPPFACSSVAVHDGEAFACCGTPGHAGKHRYLIEWNGQGDLAAQDARPALGWSRMSYGEIFQQAHGGDSWANLGPSGQACVQAGAEAVAMDVMRRWKPEAEPQPAPELATLLADWRKTADSLKHRGGVGNARERNTLEVVIGQVEAILTRPTEPAPELAAHREFAGEILGELRQALGADPDSDAEPGEAPKAHAIRLVHYLKERIDELHGLIAEGEPLSVKPSDDVKPAPELAEPVTVAGVPYSDYPSLVAAMQAEIDRERTARLHMAGERDEVRSDVARVRRAILASGKTHQWKIQQLLAIVGEIPAGEPEQPAPELAAAMAETRRYREQFEALRAELLASAEKSHPSKKSEIERSVARTIARILDGTK